MLQKMLQKIEMVLVKHSHSPEKLAHKYLPEKEPYICYYLKSFEIGVYRGSKIAKNILQIINNENLF